MNKDNIIVALIWRALAITFGGWLTYVFIAIYKKGEDGYVNPLAIAHEPTMTILIIEIVMSIAIALFGIWGLGNMWREKSEHEKRLKRYVQAKNPTSGTYVLISVKTKKIMGRSFYPFEGVKMVRLKEQSREIEEWGDDRPVLR